MERFYVLVFRGACATADAGAVKSIVMIVGARFEGEQGLQETE